MKDYTVTVKNVTFLVRDVNNWFFPWIGKSVFRECLPVLFKTSKKILVYSVCNSQKINWSKYTEFDYIICFSGENIKRYGFKSPDNILQISNNRYLISMDRCSDSRRCIYIPLAAVEPVFGSLLPKYFSTGQAKGLAKIKKTKFCCFINSNPVPFREEFVKKLSTYKRIDCTGKRLLNIDRPWPRGYQETLNRVSQYKFIISFENSSNSGYFTEKPWYGFLANTIPIYWGDPDVYMDHVQHSFLNRVDFHTDSQFIDKIVSLDHDDDLYNEMLITDKVKNVNSYDVNRLKMFLNNIINEYNI